MKSINLLIIAAILVLFVGGIMFYEYNTYDPLEVREGTQKTLEYTGFDGEKHQAIFINTGQHNWVLVEKK